uniref:Toll-like recptor 9 n=1 Tax=Oncomelania hupensis TaxID=56141 RepID=A0A2H4HHW0_9CAEN|nr:toll-like recptor 9 [Oncomelania hupensis]
MKLNTMEVKTVVVLFPLWYICSFHAEGRWNNRPFPLLSSTRHRSVSTLPDAFEPSAASRRQDIPLADSQKSVHDVKDRYQKDRPIKCDKYFCNCVGNKALCDGSRKKLKYLPQLPANIRYFRIMRSDFPYLTRPMMQNLSNFELTGINVTFNNISALSADAFADFPKLLLLDLSGNDIAVPEIRASLVGMASSVLETLSLGVMHIDFLPDDFFDGFFNKTFKKIDLQQNGLKSFNNAVFAPFNMIKRLDLSQNAMVYANMTAVTDIRKLIMEQNLFAFFPDLCLHRSPTTGEVGVFGAFPDLVSLHMTTNPFKTIEPGALRGTCFPHLQKLDISGSSLMFIAKNNFIADLPRLSTLTMNSMSGLRIYQPTTFNSSSLKILNLANNRGLNHQVLKSINDTFKYCPGLETLNIDNTVMDFNEYQMKWLLFPLQSLRYLKLQKIRSSSLLPGVLPRMSNLKRLVFTGNGMTVRQLKRALENVTSLKILNVQANNINLLREDTLPVALNLTSLDISINPFSCNCDIRWFRRWLDDVHKNKKLQVVNWPDHRQYSCATPVAMKRTPLVLYNPTDLECSVYIILGITGGVILALLLVTSLFAYRYRWHLRFCIYRLRRRKQYKQIPGETQLHTYDVYLAHSPCDIDWIMADLLPLLEGEHGLKVFLEERDTVPGSVKIDNYTKYMDESERIMLVISDNYNQDNWRQCEFQHILYASIEQLKDIIVVLIGDVQAGRMNADMRRLLTRGTFLLWGNGQQAKDTFHNGLRVALKTQDVSVLESC